MAGSFDHEPEPRWVETSRVVAFLLVAALSAYGIVSTAIDILVGAFE